MSQIRGVAPFGSSVVLPLGISLAIHGLIAAGVAFYMGHAPVPDELAQLDLTSVDLSFAETPDETAAAAPASAPMPQAAAPKPSDPEPPPPPETVQAAEPTMPAPDTTELPQPEAASEKFEVKSEELRTDSPLEDVQSTTPNSSLITPHSSPVAPRQAKVDAPPKPRRNIRPDYPRESRQRGEQGDVTLEIDVGASGAVDAVRVAKSSGFPLLDEAAAKAAKSARFTPAKSDGKPVASTARLTLNFKLK